MSTVTIFTSMTNPEERRDPWKQALNCYEDLADEVNIIGQNFPEEFKWDYFGKIFQDAFGLKQNTKRPLINYLRGYKDKYFN